MSQWGALCLSQGVSGAAVDHTDLIQATSHPGAPGARLGVLGVSSSLTLEFHCFECW